MENGAIIDSIAAKNVRCLEPALERLMVRLVIWKRGLGSETVEQSTPRSFALPELPLHDGLGHLLKALTIGWSHSENAGFFGLFEYWA